MEGLPGKKPSRGEIMPGTKSFTTGYPTGADLRLGSNSCRGLTSPSWPTSQVGQGALPEFGPTGLKYDLFEFFEGGLEKGLLKLN